jgi:two-component system phosphate regulon sensor histidine kinase PhoR
MQRRTLIQLWLVITLAAGTAILGLRTGRGGSILIAAVATAVYAVCSWLIWRRHAKYLRRLEDYAATLPAKEIDLPAELPRELAMLLSALQRASKHISSVIDRANLELARRETILAGMAEGVLAVDEHLKVTFCNEAFAQAFRTRRPLPEGRPLYEVVREPLLREILSEVLATGTPARRRVHLPAAEGRWFEVNALPLEAGAIAVLHDVTEALRQEQARKDFVANVSHELRTPLTAIRGYAETLLDGALEDPSINRKFIEVIQAHAIRLNNIASDLLVLSELDSHPSPASPAPVPLSEVIESAVRAVEPAAALGDIALQVAKLEGIVVMGNRLRLEQIFVNLLDNAVKFNRPGGCVAVECTAGHPFVGVSIRDTGIGIPSEDLKRIFDRFYRVDKARSRRVGGTGLGLSIVKESLAQMGGKISVESQLGSGTKFTVQMQSAGGPAPEKAVQSDAGAIIVPDAK